MVQQICTFSCKFLFFTFFPHICFSCSFKSQAKYACIVLIKVYTKTIILSGVHRINSHPTYREKKFMTVCFLDEIASVSSTTPHNSFHRVALQQAWQRGHLTGMIHRTRLMNYSKNGAVFELPLQQPLLHSVLKPPKVKAARQMLQCSQTSVTIYI